MEAYVVALAAILQWPAFGSQVRTTPLLQVLEFPKPATSGGVHLNRAFAILVVRMLPNLRIGHFRL